MLKISFEAPDEKDQVSPICVAAALIHDSDFTPEQLDELANHLLVYTSQVFRDRERKRAIGYSSDWEGH